MGKDIYFVAGGKGGVGKSIVCVALLDQMQLRGVPTVLIDSDTSNPDVWRAYENEVPSRLFDLDSADGWIDLLNWSDEMADHVVVVNTAARNQKGVAQHGPMMAETLRSIDRRLVALWVINRQRDSVELLRQFRENVEACEVHVVRNGYFGAEEKFELFNSSATRKKLEAAGGMSVLFPDLADRVTDALVLDRLSVRVGMEKLPLGSRAELARWRAAAGQILKPIIEHDGH